MELQKGICFLCHNKKVVGTFEADSAFHIICSLFSKEVLNVTVLKNILSSLKCCPICYHKLIILKCCGENIETNKENEDASDKCVLCKSGKVLFVIKNWPFFNNISENLVPKDKDTYIACSDCLFYLDTRNVIKSKLISKYPQLKVKSANSNGNKRKSRNTSDGLLVSTTVSRNKRKREAKDVVVISSGSDDDSAKRESYNYGSLKKFQPLKRNRIFRRREIVKSDSKFLNQIPCVLLKSFNVSNENNNKTIHNKTNNKRVSDKMVHKEKTDLNISKNKSVSSELNTIQSTPMKKTKRNRIYPKSIRLKRDKQKRSTARDLVINLTKINVLQKHRTKARNYKHDPEIEKLIDKFNVLQRPTTESSRNVDEETSNDSSKETNGVKTKRKSVSFADEKNVEIEYQNDSKINSSEVKKRKKNYQSDIPENDAQIQNIKSKEANDDVDVINSSQITKSGIADENVQENNSSEEDNDNKNAVSDEEQATNDSEDADFQAHAKIKLKIKFKPVKRPDKTTQEHENGEEESEVDKIERKKVKAKKDRPKPLSRKKRRDSVINLENVAGDDAEKSNKSMSSEDDKETSSSKSPSKKDEAGDSESSGAEETTQKPEKSEEGTEVDKIEIENQPKRQKPKPLSKKKGGNRKNSDNATGDDAERPTNSEKETSSSEKAEAGGSESSDDEETTEKRDEREVDTIEVKDKPKREKPKPLSKKKRRDSSKNLEDTAEDSANISGENTNSENDKETSTSKSKDDLDTTTVSDDETANKDDGDSVPSSEQKESRSSKEIELDTKTKLTETDVDGEGNLAADDEEPEDEINKSKESAEDSSLSKIDDGNNTSGDTSLESEEAEGNSKKTSPDEDNESEPTSGRKLDEEDDSMNGDEKDKNTPEESTQLSDSKDIDSEKNVNSEIGNDKLNVESKEAGDDAKTEDGKKVEPFDSNSFSGSDKNDELGISEDDTNNINSILTGMFTPEEQSGDNAVNEWKIVEKDADDKTNHKRKTSVDELNTSTDKKKKKVTFCEDFT